MFKLPLTSLQVVSMEWHGDEILKLKKKKPFLLNWVMFTQTNVCISVLNMFVKAGRDMDRISTPAICWQWKIFKKFQSGNTLEDLLYVLFFEVLQKTDIREWWCNKGA